ncbi:MAG: isochorismatase family cysteine hydrolase [Nitrososphaeraceae archaeon]
MCELIINSYVEIEDRTYSSLDSRGIEQQLNLSNERIAILVNDMLNDFIKGVLRSDKASEIISSIKDLISVARKKGIPVFYCNDEHVEHDPELKIWGPHSMKGTEGSQVISELEPDRHDRVVPKRFYGSFDSTNLDTLLKESYEGRGATTLIITGIHTHICILHTSYGAFIRGYSIIIPEDAVNAFTREDHESGISYIKNNYGAKIMRTSEIVMNLTQDGF